MSQPVWKLIAQLGDVNPIEHGGYFVYEDTTGVYPPEAEWLEAPDSDDAPGRWTVYRFSPDRCTYVDGVLSDNEYHPYSPAWFADDMGHLGESIGRDLIADICSEKTIRLALAYRAIGEHHGFINLDGYPLTFHNRADVEARYAE